MPLLLPLLADALTASDLDAWIREEPLALWALLLSKYGMAFVGLIFLVLWWIRRDRIRAGILPATPRVEPTMPFPLPVALALLGVALILLQVVGIVLPTLELEGAAKTAASMGAVQAALLAVAIVVLARRRQLQAGPHDSVRGAAWAAFRTFAVASAFVVPVMFLSILILQALEVPITLYGPVQSVVEGNDPYLPWILLVLAGVLAPICEESLFRGMLYPAIRKAVGPRRGPLVAAVITSLLFALIHWHAASFLPLFTLAMVFAFVIERTDSLAAVIGAHALWNLSTMLPLMLRSLS